MDGRAAAAVNAVAFARWLANAPAAARAWRASASLPAETKARLLGRRTVAAVVVRRSALV